MTAAQIRKLLNPAPHLHIAPTRPLAQRIRASLNPDTGNLTYHFGSVMLKNYSVPIFWMPPTLQSGASATPSANYVSLIERYLADIGGSQLYGIATQYTQLSGGHLQFITNTSGLVQAILDTSAYPTAGSGCGPTTGPGTNGQDCVDDSQLRAEITKVINAHPAFTGGLTTTYFVFLAPHESQCVAPSDCFDADTDPTPANFLYCAYHNQFTLGAQKVVYASLPYGGTARVNGCTQLSSFPNDKDADIEISTTSHEQIEATTDPDAASGWYFQDTSGEIGDECAYNYGTVNLDSNLANILINGHFYVVQQEWSNAVSGCSIGTPAGDINDNFANALALPPQGGTVDGSNVAATKESGEPNIAGNGGGKSVWWSWTPNGSGNVTVDTCTTTFDTLIGVYTGTALNNLTSVASNDNSDACGSGSHQSSVTFFASFGTTYEISVDGFNNGGGASNGNLVLHASNMTGAPPTAPSINAVTAGDAWVSVAFSAPSNTGDTPIGSYVATVGTRSTVVPGTARRAVITGLTDGTSVTATVSAVNLGGQGPASASSSPVTPTSGTVNETTHYNTADNNRLLKNATFFGTNAIDAQRSSVGVVAFIVGIVHSPVITPVVPTPTSSGPNSYTTPWSTSQQGPLVTVMRQYALTPSEAQYFSVTLVGFLLSLGGH